MTITAFESKLQDKNAVDLRAADEATRASAGTVAIIDVAVLMRDVVTFMPEFATEPERKAYIEAVKDIAIHANAAQLMHEHASGELRRGGRHLRLPEDLVGAAYRQRMVARS